ncbi:pyrroloquinoline quinone-dependent dehydrogenase [Agrobacterium sp. T29]|uniref:pyrroloquinoline quinone-dependent dehydrogenase n=1 Tax=Agrobacterium sp. T29 TaxID=2580515 RepID=UPI00115CE6B1|nr:pyrroloquinoline quinone-dependent dehydrogenase [Agrobacterium sp. T29]
MRRRTWALSVLGAALFVAISLLGGSAFWVAMNGANDLTISGKAEVARADPVEEDNGWSSYGRDPGGSRYSSASQITPQNVSTLQVAWSMNTGALEGKGDAAKSTAFEATPILVENKLIFCTQFNEVVAVHPATGAVIWRHDPKVATDRKPTNQYTCRGISFWKDSNKENGVCAKRIISGTVDSRLIALDADTGVSCDDFGHGGAVEIEPDIRLRWPGEFQITSAPAIIGDTVITGSSIGDNLRQHAPLGTVHAFDTRTGALKWRFNPIPRDPNDPLRTNWKGDSADTTGAANTWSTISVDVKRNLIFLATSSPSPDHYGGNRIGDNRHANSIVALNADTGKVVWSYQLVHHDLWDYDLPAQPGLYTIWRDGKEHDVVAVVSKMGLVFVLDRDTGKPFLPIEERPVPQTDVKGEVTSPTQPFPVAPEGLVSSVTQPDKAFGITLWDKYYCSRKISSLRREGLYTPPSVQGTMIYPFLAGGANWGSAAYDPQRNLMIINMSNLAGAIKLVPKSKPDAGATDAVLDGMEEAPMEDTPYSLSYETLVSPLGLPCTPPPWGVLAAVDLGTGEIVWRRPHGTTEDLAGGLALSFGTPTIGGPIVTKTGVIFIGAAMDDYLRAYDIESGRELWKGRLPAGGQATPMTYMFEGRQYVVLAAGGHSFSGTRLGDTVIAYTLPLQK